MLTTKQRDHLKAEGAALNEGRPFCYWRLGMTYRVMRARAPATAHVAAYHHHKANAVMDDFIARYSLAR